MLTNMAKGRKGIWHVRNAAKWDRKENKAREAEVRAQAEFIHGFIYDEEITIEDSMAVYAAGRVYEQKWVYSFLLKQSNDSPFGVMAESRFLRMPQAS